MMLGEYAVRQENITVGATAIAVADEVPQRNFIFIRNIGATNITLSAGKTATLNLGILLKPGEYFLDTISEGYRPYRGSYSAIGDAGGGSLAVVER